MDYLTGNIEIDHEIIIKNIDDSNFTCDKDKAHLLKSARGIQSNNNIYSSHYGFDKKRSKLKTNYNGLYWTDSYIKNKELHDILLEYAGLYLPDKFIWNQCHIKKNYYTPNTRDNINGPSIIVGMGDYTGGNLSINKNGKIFNKSVKNIPTKFYGNKYTYCDTHFIGNRYVLQFYQSHTKKELRALQDKFVVNT